MWNSTILRELQKIHKDWNDIYIYSTNGQSKHRVFPKKGIFLLFITVSMSNASFYESHSLFSANKYWRINAHSRMRSSRFVWQDLCEFRFAYRYFYILYWFTSYTNKNGILELMGQREKGEFPSVVKVCVKVEKIDSINQLGSRGWSSRVITSFPGWLKGVELVKRWWNRARCFEFRM